MKVSVIILLIMVSVFYAQAHEISDTTGVAVRKDTLGYPYKFEWKQLIAPAALITTGTVGMRAGWFKGLNNVVPPTESNGSKQATPVDDVIQYTPIAGLYILKLCGVRSKHDYLETTLLLTLAWMMSASAVQIGKHEFTVWRPDGSMSNSFPSGHSATAFMGAELLRQEFKDTNPWIGYSGYAVAVATGALRVYHDRHWLTDVLAGAGIGILSTRVAYWIYPYVTKYIFPHLYRQNVYLSAFGSPSSAGLSFTMRF